MSQLENAIDVFAKVMLGLLGLVFLIGGGVCVVTDVIGIASSGLGEVRGYSILLLIALAMVGGGGMILKSLISQERPAKSVYRDHVVSSDQAQKNSGSNGNDSGT